MSETVVQEKDLKTALAECQISAKTGYKIASAQEKVLSRTLNHAQEKVQKTIDELSCSKLYAPESSRLLEEQLVEIKSDFCRLSALFKDDLVDLHEDLSKFSITLFGRTTAGKSTLMEVLTEGDGSSIGKGAQRTTKDVRHYLWNGLEITDVPGVAAFEGEEDDQIAFEATKGADLVLFLLTDNAPQYKEAEWLSRIIHLGKPVICIMNVRASISSSDDIATTEWIINEKFESTRLTQLHDQFMAYSDKFGQMWNHVPFVYVHLRSAFLSQHEEDREISKRLYSLSRIENLTSLIVEQVITQGKFYRVKTFIDTVSVPLMESMSSLLEQSQINSFQGRTVLAKKRELISWKDQFFNDGMSTLESFATKIESDLKGEAATFVEDHLDDKNVSAAWLKVMNEKRLEEKCQSVLKRLSLECNDKLLEVSREISNELEFSASLSNQYSFSAKKIVDGKRIAEWSSLGLSGALGIVAVVAGFMGATIAGPLGVAATVVYVVGTGGSKLLKSRNQKEDLIRKKLNEELRNIIENECLSLQEQMESNLKQLVSSKIDTILDELDSIIRVVYGLADTQQELAWRLNDHILSLNRQIVDEAISVIEREYLKEYYTEVARIPGYASLLLLSDGIRFPDEERERLISIMSEQIIFNYGSPSNKVLISRVLGKDVDRRKIHIEKKINVAHVPLKEKTPEMERKICLAQQLSGLSIME